MTAIQHAKHAARRPRRPRTITRTGFVAVGALALAPMLGAAPSSAGSFSMEATPVPLVDFTPTYLALTVEPGDGSTAPTTHEWTLEGKKDQTLAVGLSGSFTDMPSVRIHGSCRTLIAQLADSAFAFVADHAYQPTRQDPVTGAPVADGSRKTDQHGRSATADTPNSRVALTVCR